MPSRHPSRRTSIPQNSAPPDHGEPKTPSVFSTRCQDTVQAIFLAKPPPPIGSDIFSCFRRKTLNVKGFCVFNPRRKGGERALA